MIELEIIFDVQADPEIHYLLPSEIRTINLSQLIIFLPGGETEVINTFKLESGTLLLLCACVKVCVHFFYIEV